MSLAGLLADVLLVGHTLFAQPLPLMLEQAARHQGARVVVESAAPQPGTSRAAGAVVVDGSALPGGAAGGAEAAAWLRDLAALAGTPDRVFLLEPWPAPAPASAPDATAWAERVAADAVLWRSVAAVAGREGAPVLVIPAAQVLARILAEIEAGAMPDFDSPAALMAAVAGPDDRARYALALAIHGCLGARASVTGRVAGLPPRLVRRFASRDSVVTEPMARRMQAVVQAVLAEGGQCDPARAPVAVAAVPVSGGADGVGAASPVAPPVPPGETAAAATPETGDDDRAASTPGATGAPPQAGADAASARPAPGTDAAAARVPGDDPGAIAAFDGVRNPALGLGLEGVTDWTAQQPFIDVFKTARPWTGHLPGQFGGWTHDDLARGGWLDADGWPRAIPPELTGISALILTNQPPDVPQVAARYRVTWQGRGVLRIEGLVRNLVMRSNEAWFDFVPGDGLVALTITDTDLRRDGDHLRNIVVLREDHIAEHAAGALFNPDWLRRLRGVALVRFMDWMGTNGSVLVRPEDRPKPGDYTWGRVGVPLEVMLALANELGAEPWFTLPWGADAAFHRLYAETVRDGLAPGLRAHVELSNEVWNGQFAQARDAEAEAQARWGRPLTGVQLYAARAVAMAAQWREIFGPEADSRLVRVIATHTGWLGRERDILEAPLWVAEDPAGRSPPWQHFDAYAVTGYFAAGLGAPQRAAILRGWLAESRAVAEAGADALGLAGAARVTHVAQHRHDLAVDRAVADLRDGAVTGQREDTLAHLLTEVLPYHRQVAQAHGLALAMYEGGTHVVGHAEVVEDAELTDFFIHLNYSPGMAALYAELLAGWSALTSEPFNAFVDVSRPSRWGSWGALRHLYDDNPRWRVLAGHDAAP